MVESSDDLAVEIALLAGKPVLSVESNVLAEPSGLPFVKQRTKDVMQDTVSLVHRATRKIKRLCLRYV